MAAGEASMQRGTFLFLVDGRVFVMRDDGDITEADANERRSAARALAYADTLTLDPMHGFGLATPADS